MEKERKTIKCSYAVLVIILFAALAFVTDYAIIERKTMVNKCPKCENICTKCDVKEENSVVEESNEQVNENNEIIKYEYKDVVGHYRYSDDAGITDYYFYENGTLICSYEDYLLKTGGYDGGSGGYLGSYYIDQNKIRTSILFEYYDEDGKLYYKPNNAAASGGNDFEIIDVNSLYATGSGYMFQRNNNESMNPDLYVEKIANSQIIYGSLLNSGEPRS